MFSAKNIVLLTEINGFFDASLLHNYMDVIENFIFPLSSIKSVANLRQNIKLNLPQINGSTIILNQEVVNNLIFYYQTVFRY